MRVAYNGLFLTRPFTGTGQYTRQFLTAMAGVMKDAELVVFVPERISAELPKSVRVQVLSPSRGWLGRGLALDRWETTDIGDALGDTGVDLYHTTYPTPPVSTAVPTVMTVHDMIPWQFPQYRQGARRRIKLGRILRGIQAADHLCTVSEASKHAINRLTVVAPERVTVTYDGLDAAYFKSAAYQRVRKTKDSFGLERPFILYLGGYDYRKNIRVLIEGFSRSGLADTHDLVLAGALTAPATKLYADFATLPKLVREAGIEHAVRRTGFVDEAEKHALLTGADAFAYPSLAEGFGLPILEALGVGTPVVAAATPVNTELFGRTIQTFEPDKVDLLAKELHGAATKPSAARKKAGRALAKKFTWDRVAERTATAYDRVLKARP